ncbi:hypothetical protein F4808DRAFT_340514 [Astrocystis sublimbata]|nr:hypothetical protein F4808DRAFT_340514 [Astrocystis sublimbata]
MERELPQPNYTTDEEWRWPWWKFDLPPEALFTTLHQRFNTHSLALQEPTAFLVDVRDTANRSATCEEFYAALEERRRQRRLELEDAWIDTATRIVAYPGVFEEVGQPQRRSPTPPVEDEDDDKVDEHWGDFLDLVGTMSFDRLVCFFDGFIRERRKQSIERSRRTRIRLGMDPDPPTQCPTQNSIHPPATPLETTIPTAVPDTDALPHPTDSISERAPPNVHNSNAEMRGLV